VAKNHIKKIVIGTAQFGLAYGISNNTGRTCLSETKDIFRYLEKKSIKFIDTASLYGNSEKLIGELNLDKHWKIITKTPVFSEKRIEDTHVNCLRDSFKSSLRLTGKTTMEGLMIHNCEDLLKPGGGKLFKEMDNLKSSGLVNKIGVSAYDSNQIKQILEKYEIDIIQLPVSIFDQRLVNDGCLKKLKSNGIEIYARSIFLQGLLLMNHENIPSYFNPVKSSIEDFDRLSKGLIKNKISLAASFVMSLKEVDYVVIGVNSSSHIKQIVKIIENISNICVDNYKYLSINNPSFVNPSNWEL